MLKEIITFVDKYNDNGNQLKKDWKEKKLKFVIIKTKDKNDSPSYDGVEILDDDIEIKRWIDKNKHYEEIIKNINRYILPSGINKALGSTGGLATYSFFVFKLSEKNICDLEKKIDKTKFQKDEHKELLQHVHKILKDAIPDLTKKQDGNFSYLNSFALIRTDGKRFAKWKEITDEFIEERTSEGNKSLSTDGKCFVCNKEGKVSTPSFLTSYAEKKIFLKHNTRYSKDGKGVPLRACGDCVQKLNHFQKILRHHKIKIFPLFVKPNELIKEIKWLSSNLEEDENKFDFIFKQLADKENIFNFYLVVLANDYFFFDYVTGYKWTVGEYTKYFSDDRQTFPVTRYDLELELARALTDKYRINYFDKIKGVDNQQATLIYALRQKVFDFVYRNQNTLTTADIQGIILHKIEKSIRNNSKPARETFNLFFNRHLLLGNNSQTGSILDDKVVIDAYLGKVTQTKEDIISDNVKKVEVGSDEEWAYFAGQLAYYLISLSKSKSKNYGLLEPFINKSTVIMVNRTILDIFQQYKHEIGINSKRFKKIATCVLSYKSNNPFIELKIPFYVGALDDNIMYQTKKEGVNK